VIRTRIRAEDRPSRLGPYEPAYLNFRWEKLYKEFSWHQSGQYNLVQEAIDRWAEPGQMPEERALVYERGGEVSTYSFRQIKELSCQWANMLAGLGLASGDRLVVLLPPRPELHLAVLAAARLGAIFCALPPDLTPHELYRLMARVDPKVMVTTPHLARRLPAEALPGEAVLLLTEGSLPGLHPREELVPQLLPAQAKECATRWVEPNHPLYLVFTSGGDGPPRGSVHVHGGMVGLMMTGRYVLDLGPGSLCWTDGLPGWVTSTVYGGLAPWLCGSAVLLIGDEFSPPAWYRALEHHKPTTWYTRPGVIELLKQAGDDLVKRYDLTGLGHVATVGRTLPPKNFFWFRNNFDRHIHDTWWSAEMGMIALAHFPGTDIKLGSAGLPVPGVQVAVVDDQGQSQPLLTLGELAFKPGWPAMFSSFWGEAGREDGFFRQGWYLSGDLATTDEDGYYYLHGRKDDILRVRGRLVGPYEVERALERHPAVAECAVILPPTEGALWFKAFVVLRYGHKAVWELKEVLKALARAEISPDLPLRELEFMPALPRNAKRRLLRRVLKARELGLPTGDAEALKEDWTTSLPGPG
jgi:acetyl-CoA synthetase